MEYTDSEGGGVLYSAGGGGEGLNESLLSGTGTTGSLKAGKHGAWTDSNDTKNNKKGSSRGNPEAPPEQCCCVIS